jgi:hypothetical protein
MLYANYIIIIIIIIFSVSKIVWSDLLICVD